MVKDFENAEFDAGIARFQSKSQQHPNGEEIVRQGTDLQESSSGYDEKNDLEKEKEGDESALAWIKTHESQHSHTVGAKPGSKRNIPSLPKMGGGKPYPPDLPGQEEYLVEFDGSQDRTHPQNWPMGIKLVPLKAK